MDTEASLPVNNTAQAYTLTLYNIINTAKYINKKYKADQFVNIIRSHNNNEPNRNSTVRTAAKIINELSQTRTMT
jgi:hypothetical protein